MASSTAAQAEEEEEEARGDDVCVGGVGGVGGVEWKKPEAIAAATRQMRPPRAVSNGRSEEEEEAGGRGRAGAAPSAPTLRVEGGILFCKKKTKKRKKMTKKKSISFLSFTALSRTKKKKKSIKAFLPRALPRASMLSRSRLAAALARRGASSSSDILLRGVGSWATVCADGMGGRDGPAKVYNLGEDFFFDGDDKGDDDEFFYDPFSPPLRGKVHSSARLLDRDHIDGGGTSVSRPETEETHREKTPPFWLIFWEFSSSSSSSSLLSRPLMTFFLPFYSKKTVDGRWTRAAADLEIPDPMNGETMVLCPDTQVSEEEENVGVDFFLFLFPFLFRFLSLSFSLPTPFLSFFSLSLPTPNHHHHQIPIQISEAEPFVSSLARVPKSGLHNPLKNPERYQLYGAVTARAAEELRKPEVERFFSRLVQRTSPKSDAQARAEVVVTRRFLENFGGDQPRFTASSRVVAGDHSGQSSAAHRWPFGGVGLVTPFNFPLEIPALQVLGALYMGNKPLVHVDRRVSVAFEQFVRLLHHCGAPLDDLDIVNGQGAVAGHVLKKAPARSTLFTGSRAVAEKLCSDLGGRVFLEDAGFDWKVLGPDVAPLSPSDAASAAGATAATDVAASGFSSSSPSSLSSSFSSGNKNKKTFTVPDVDYVAWQCDQDAYACSGQKCSAQSILFAHENWTRPGVDIEARLAERAARRKLSDLTVGPVLTWTTEAMLSHVSKLAALPGARVAFGGKALSCPGVEKIPKQYGAIEPTAVFVPLETILASKENFNLVTTEVFGPVQVLTTYSDSQLGDVLRCLERMEAHLTAAVVSNDPVFLNAVLGATCNGTTYAGARARTTGAPQNHWFGPAGDPRGAGIGTTEAIRLVWSCHREVISDFGPGPLGAEMETT